MTELPLGLLSLFHVLVAPWSRVILQVTSAGGGENIPPHSQALQRHAPPNHLMVSSKIMLTPENVIQFVLNLIKKNYETQ